MAVARLNPESDTADTGQESVARPWLLERYEELSRLPDTPENRRQRFQVLMALRASADEWEKLNESVFEFSLDMEKNNAGRLMSILVATGWQVTTEVPITGRDGGRFRVDLLVSHPDLPDATGAIEVKDAIGPAGRDYVDAVKQAADYVGGATSLGEIVSWAAVYPVIGAFKWLRGNRPGYGDSFLTREHVAFMSGVFELASKHLKVHALFHEPRSYMPRGDRLVLMYLNRHVMWCEEGGFRATARAQLCGKRQVGGQRL